MSKPPSPLHVLIVEDDDNHALLLETSWAKQNRDAQLTRCRDGVEARNYLDTLQDTPDLRPDLVILDLKMPRRSGFEVLDDFKTDDRYRKIPVVVLTTSDNDQDRQRAYDHHANSYVVKPMDFDAFGTMVGQLDSYWARVNRPCREAW
ncbi:MAG: response regulator [Planctomycetota bacterium]